MKKYAALTIMVLTLILGGCAKNDILEGLPEKISDFIEEYYPGQSVSYADFVNDGSYRVRLKNSALLTFGKENSWKSVNGYGNTLPQMFLFDQLPPALFQYLQEMEVVNGVYGVSRDNRIYMVALLNRSIIYNIEDGSITIPATGAQLLDAGL